MANLRKVMFFMIILMTVTFLLALWKINKHNQTSIEVGNIMYKAALADVSENEILLSKVASEVNSNYKYLAQFKLASIHSNKNLNETLKIYSNLASNNKLAPVLYQLAEYLEASALVKIGTQNKEKIYTLPIDKIYNYSNKEVIAVCKLKSNEITHATDILNSIVDDHYSPLPTKKDARELLQISSLNN